MQAEQLFLSAFAGKTIFLKEGFTMKKDGYYSSGEFARMAHVTLRTIRYYDKQNILKPSYVTESGARFYTDEDFARLSQILLLKYLGFSLDDIREMTIDDSDYHFMENSLNIQLKLGRDWLLYLHPCHTRNQESLPGVFFRKHPARQAPS